MGVRSFDALGFDPAPGDVAPTGDAAETIRGVVEALSEVEGVRAGERDGRWEGKAAEAFRNSVADELTPRVQRALSSFSEAAEALRQWVGQLESFQGRAQRLEERAREARDDLRAAQRSLDALPQPGQVAESHTDEVQRDRLGRRAGSTAPTASWPASSVRPRLCGTRSRRRRGTRPVA